MALKGVNIKMLSFLANVSSTSLATPTLVFGGSQHSSPEIAICGSYTCCTTSAVKQGAWLSGEIEKQHCKCVASSAACWEPAIFPSLAKELLEQFKVHSKIERKVQRFTICHLPAHMYSLSHYQCPDQSGAFFTTVKLQGHITVTPSPRLTVAFILGGVHSVGLEKCIMMSPSL